MIRTSILFLAVLVFGLVPGCLAVGPFSSESLQKGENIVIKGETFNEDIDLTEILEFHPSVPGVMKAVVKGDVVFEKCNFYKFLLSSKKEGKTYMIEFRGDVVFDECLFRDTVDFSNVVINGDFHAGTTEFSALAKFNYAWFKGRNNNFTDAGFYNKALFNGSIFDNRTRFFKTEFKDAAMFQSVVFKGHSFWGAARFNGYTEFGKSRFIQDLDMSEVLFSGRTNFNHMNCLMTARFNNAEFAENVDFSGATFYQDAEFYDSIFESERMGVEDYINEE
ncbi:MAG: pentapeptide repeat-containing protein [Bacteroidota bacterium]